ncbi:hypothetical protein FRC18_000027 [Serendipita sp. 400]|nr:hypothetical protein FRC18_000027 [Serendipita sp. 400]
MLATPFTVIYSSPLRLSLSRILVKTHCRTFFTLPSGFSPFGGAHDSGDDAEDDLQRYHERKIMPYTRRQLYSVVSDVDSYHQFIPFCTGSDVLKSSRSDWKTNSGSDGDPAVHLEAELKVGFLGMDERYVSKVECKPFELVQVRRPLFNRLFLLLFFLFH